MNRRESLFAFRDFMQAKNLAAVTIQSYGSTVQKFVLSFPINPKEITYLQAVNYLSKIDNPHTKKQVVCSLKSYYRNVLNQKKMDKLTYPKIGRKLPEYITKQQFYEGLNKIQNKKHRLIVLLLYGCGLRIGELINLKTRNVRKAIGNGGLFYYLEIRCGKGGKDRNVPLPELIQRLIDFDLEYVIDNRGKYSASSVRKIVRRYFDTYPHALRHSYATELVNQDTSLKKIADLLGHAKTTTTERYSHTSVAGLASCSVL